MAELPELETIRRDLDREIGGKKIKTVEADSMSLLARYKNRKGFTSPLEGRKIGGVSRRGQMLVFDIGEDEVLVCRLADGVVRRAANKDATESGTEVVITLTQGGQVRFVDPDGTGELFVLTKDELAELPELTGLGFDPVDQPMSWAAFGQSLIRHDTKLKTLLTDPSFVVGIGPVYSDEILHAALLRGDRPASGLTTQEIRRLYRAVVETMHNAIKHRGTTVGETGWKDVHGEPGGYNEYLEVFDRAGERSRNGRGQVQKTRIGNQTHFYAEYQV